MTDTKDFIIKDKRLFAEGSKDHEAEKQKAEPETEKPKDKTPEEEAAKEKERTEYQLPAINFATFIFSLNHSVLVHLGATEDPMTGKREKNLSLAKQTIDILGMLEEKTQGNLTKDEEKMLKNMLYDLRMIYIKEKQ
jgi:Domain of unknown function (DUF1844)